MTTSFPTSVDSFVRPIATDALTMLKDLVDLEVIDDTMDAIEALETAVGAVAGTTIATTTATEVTGVRTVTITGTDVPITVGNTTGVSFGSVKVFDFPQGLIRVLGAALTTGFSYDFTPAGNSTPIAGTMGGDFGFGTTAVSDGTIGGADEDIIPETSIDPLSTPVNAFLAADIAAPFDGHTTATAIYLNHLIDDADVANAASDDILISFVLKVTYVNLGDW